MELSCGCELLRTASGGRDGRDARHDADVVVDDDEAVVFVVIAGAGGVTVTTAGGADGLSAEIASS